jgi:hypothetical protein
MYDAYLSAWRQKLNLPVAGLAKVERCYRHYARYNHARAQQVHAAYDRSSRLRTAIAAIRRPHAWMVITEDWCGDSAYSLPVIAEAAASNAQITLCVFPRDDHLDLMDRYLTNGARSIPKLVAFDADGDELFQWGPRLAAAQALRTSLQAAGMSAVDVSAAVLAWYEGGGGQQVDEELSEALEAHVLRVAA